jgi:hypothetical protein
MHGDTVKKKHPATMAGVGVYRLEVSDALSYKRPLDH